MAARLAGLKDVRTVKRGDSYSIYLSSAKLDQLRALTRKMKETTAVLIDGKMWAISYRFPFPDEAMVHTLKNEKTNE